MTRQYLLLTTLFLLLFFGQSKAYQPPTYDVHKLTVAQGLAHSDVRGICQDDYGFLWIATLKGLSLFDGKQVQNIQAGIDDNKTLPTNRILSMKKGAKGNLWLLLENQGISIVNTEDRSFTNIHLLQSASSEDLIDFRNAGLEFMAIGEQNVYLASPNGLILSIGLDKDGKPITVETIKEKTDKKLIQNQNKIRGVFTDKKGNLWIGTRFGLYVKPKGGEIKKVPVPEKIRGIRAVYSQEDNKYLLGASNGLFEYNAEDESTQQLHTDKPIHFVTSIIERSNKEIWVGTKQGIWILNKHGQIKLLNPDYTSKVNRVTTLFEDDAHAVWIGCNAIGVRYISFSDKTIENIPLNVGQDNGIPNGFVTCINKIDNYLLIGSIEKYLNFYNQETSEFINIPISEEKVSISAIHIGKDKRIWVGTKGYGLFVSEKPFTSIKSIKWVKLLDTYQKSFEQNDKPRFITDIEEDKHGNIWFTTNNFGILCYFPESEKLEVFEELDNRNRFHGTSLFYEPISDLLWLSTANQGLYRFKLNHSKIVEKKQYRHVANNSTTISTNYIWSVVRDFENRIWVGTIGGGLNLLKDEEKGIFEKITEKNGLWDNDTECILVDKKHRKIWIAGSTISSYDPKTKDFRHYTPSDGILNENGFKVGADFLDKDGTMYFGGVNGIAYINPNKPNQNIYTPHIRLTDLSINDRKVGIGEEVDGRVVLEKGLHVTDKFVLTANQKDFNISFTAIYPSAIEQVEYIYQLKGYNEEWHKVGKGENKVYYSNLPSGEYEFAVKTRISNGSWSDEAKIMIEVERPVWLQWYSILTFIVVLLIILLIVNWYYIKQQKLSHNLELAEVGRQKDHELMEQKLKFFTNVSHELRTPLTLMQGPLEELVKNRSINSHSRENILLAFNQTNKLLQLVNQLMDFRKMETQDIHLKLYNGNFYEFLYEIYSTFRLNAKSKNIDYQIVTDDFDLIMAYDKEKMEMVFMNLLSNAFKFTEKGGRIILRMETVVEAGEQSLKVSVEDNGLGIAKEALDKIFDRFYQAGNAMSIQLAGSGIGLTVAKGIVEAHNGDLTVESEKGKGTIFTMKIPVVHTEAQEADIPQTYFVSDALVEKEEEESQNFEGIKLLIVEDNTEIRTYLKKLFAGTCEVLEAENGQEGLNILYKEKNIQLVISDIMMPVMNGLDLCNKVKSDPNLWHVPVFLLTARSSPTHELEGLEYGADSYITKPFRPAILKQKVVNTLKHRNHLLSMYNNVMKLQQPVSLYSQELEDEFLEKTIKIVESHLDNPEFNVQILVNEIAMSQSALYKKMKEVTGKSLVEFIKDVRMRKAGELLVSTKMKVFEVAYAVGFNDVKYFRKCFKDHYGVSSTEYVKQFNDMGKV